MAIRQISLAMRIVNHELHRWLRAVLVTVLGFSFSVFPSPIGAPDERSNSSPSLNWNPIEGAPLGARYAGSAACGECHASQVERQKRTAMAHAAESPAENDILRKHPNLRFHLGQYQYRVTADGNRNIYWVSDDKRKISVPILWTFGRGEAGQTYVFEWNGAYYQSRVSFFNDIRGLDITLGAPRSLPASLEDALGDRIGSGEARLCIACHTTGAIRGGELRVDGAILGVTCEACHGPGGDHVSAMRAGNSQRTLIFNPGRLAPGDLNNFCGSCHRTWAQVQLMHLFGIKNVRFQPYRLQSSLCWNAEDARISCIACHDPHESRRLDNVLVDSKCLSCHLHQRGPTSLKYPGAACPVGTHRCMTCHMPKYELPGAHFKFTDHEIRIVRAGEPYPD